MFSCSFSRLPASLRCEAPPPTHRSLKQGRSTESGFFAGPRGPRPLSRRFSKAYRSGDTSTAGMSFSNSNSPMGAPMSFGGSLESWCDLRPMSSWLRLRHRLWPRGKRRPRCRSSLWACSTRSSSDLSRAWHARQATSRDWPLPLRISPGSVWSYSGSSFPSSGESPCSGTRRVGGICCNSEARRSPHAR